MKGFFGSLFGNGHKPRNNGERVKAEHHTVPERKELELYKKGDVIGGKYEVLGKLGKGGFGIVYLAQDRETNKVCALKTFRDEFLANLATREAFKKEALLWVNLEAHPFILIARWVSEISGRLFVEMEYIAPDAQGRVSLTDHLTRSAAVLDTNQILKWAIQFCFGMEHARAQGVQCHRDIKPDNILITQDGTLKISDFGLAAAAEAAWRGSSGPGDSLVTGGAEDGFGFSLVQAEGKMRCGTPGYIAPEVYRCEGADIRSDIYSFGLVLWQMATGSQMPPFMVRWRGIMDIFLREIYEQQMSGRVLKAKSRLDPIIERCLRPEPSERYKSFEDLRATLEPIWEQRMGRKFAMTEATEKTAVFWNCKGGSLDALNRCEEAIICFDKALAINPQYADAWNNKGNALNKLGRHGEAISCYDEALVINSKFAEAWNNKGNTLNTLGRHEEAVGCFDKALAIDLPNAYFWNNKGIAFNSLGRHQEAITCFEKALAIDLRFTNAWNNKGNALQSLGQIEEAIGCYDKALVIDPRNTGFWNNKGNALAKLGQREKAIGCYEKALVIDPQNASAWNNKGFAFHKLGRHENAIVCHNKALAIQPQDWRGLYGKALSEDALQHWREAVSNYRKVLELASSENAELIKHAKQRLRELATKEF